MKKNFYVLFAVLIANIFQAQSELVRWTKDDLSPVLPSQSNITASNIQTSGVSFSPTTWSDSFFTMSGTSSTSIDTNRYVQFSVAPKANYKITLSSFNISYRAQQANAKIEIRYSTNTDFSNPKTLYSANSTNDANWQSLTLNNFTNPVIDKNKALLVRIYVYATSYDSFHFKYTPNGGVGTGPNITGTVAVDTPTVPIANNDAMSVPKNNDGVFDILANDVSSSAINSITITQQPAHGTLTVNGTNNVTFKPTIGFTGNDIFKYTTTNTIGVSNEATVSVAVKENVDTTLVRWNNANYEPTSGNSHLTSGKMTSTQQISFVSNLAVGGGYNAFQTSGWPDKNVQTVDTSKYIQFTISPSNGYKLNLTEFNFLCAMQGGDANIRIDYALNSNFSNPITILPQTTITSAISTISLTNFSKPIATDGQILYLRVYVYNTWNDMQILLKDAQNEGPAFIGNVEYSSTVPIAYNDTITNIVNNDIDINVLVNDDYSNTIDAITFTQPSHGSTTINTDKSLNYLPAKDYIGTDSFSYYITNKNGISNTATVNINVTSNSSSPLVRWDKTNFSATAFQAFINSTKMTSTAGMTLNVGGETNPKTFYIESSGNSESINTSRYVQFVLDNTSTKKTVEPKTFGYIAKGTSGANYEIRYSKTPDFSSDVVVLKKGTVPTDYSNQSFNFDEGLKLEPNEKLYFRLYFYNSDYVQYVIQFLPGAMGPEIDGLFYNSVYSPNTTIWLNANSPHWSNGIPNATKSAIVDTDYKTELYGNFASNNLTINSGASLNINTGGYITVNGQIANNSGTNKFLVENNANLLQNGSSQNTGNITVQKTALLPKMGYNYWSTPVIGQNLYQFSDGYNQANGGTGTGTPWNRFFIYNEANDNFVNTIANDITLNNTSLFISGRGYAIRGKNSFPDKITSTSPTTTFEFKGIPQNGDVSFILKYSNAAHGFNMVGNPYPSNLSFDDLFNYNSSKIYGVAYCWTNNDDLVTTQQSSNYQGNNYAIYNGTGGTSATYFGYNNRKPNGHVSVGQGFIVQARAAGKNQPLVFKNSMRTAEIANFYNKGGEKASNKDRFWLELKSPTNVNNEILIGYMDASTNDYDSDYDTDLLAVGNDSFWSVLDSHKLGIQARKAPLYSEDVVKLAVKAAADGDYTISITDREGVFADNQDVLLKDTYLNKIVNLKNTPYVFSTNAGQYEDRFQIIYKIQETLGTNNAEKKGIQIYKDVQNFIVRSDENLENVSLYDSLGRLLFNSKNAKKEILIDKSNLTEGMYIIKANSRNTMMTKKVLK